MITLIIESSEISLRDIFENTLKEYRRAYVDVIEQTSIENGVNEPSSLFTNPVLHLNLNDKKDLKSFCDYSKRLKRNVLKNLKLDIIITTLHKQGSKTVVDIVKDCDGIVIESKNKEETKKELLKELKLTKDVTAFISEYVGEDYELIVGIKNALKNVSKKDVTLDNIHTFMPYKKGTVPPWEYISSVYKKDIKKALEELERVLENTYCLVLVALLKNKAKLHYKYILAKEGKKSEDEIVKALSLSSNYVLKDFRGLSTSLSACENILYAIYKAECELKGDMSNGISVADYLKKLTVEIIIRL